MEQRLIYCLQHLKILTHSKIWGQMEKKLSLHQLPEAVAQDTYGTSQDPGVNWKRFNS